MVEIEIRKFKEVNLAGGTILEGFPGIGIVGPIAGTYLIDYLKMDQICALDSEDFPPTSMVYANKPKFPARIYASSDHKIALFLSEFTPSLELHRPIAKKLLEWAKEQQCKRFICMEGLPSEVDIEPGGDGIREIDVFGVGSTDNARDELKKADIKKLETGIIYGVSGILLNEGRWENFDVITLLAEAYIDVPDALAATRVLEALNKLMPNIKIDTKPLLEQSKKFEEHLKGLRKQAELPVKEPYKAMYG
ncbi:MAG: proteasome assembly chaperone family protein [Thermoplasmata archaeon]|nr:MAG: proteasome assembly chaperone family protein [Thermoplasmata archaeon]